MLVLTRRAGQRIMIGADIVITVASIVGNKVRIGIEATPDIQILRDNAGASKAPNAAKTDAPNRLSITGS